MELRVAVRAGLRVSVRVGQAATRKGERRVDAEPTSSRTARQKRVACEMYGSAIVRSSGRLAPVAFTSLSSHDGNPPKSHSLQMYGPGRSTTKRPCLCASRRKLERLRILLRWLDRSPLRSFVPKSMLPGSVS